MCSQPEESSRSSRRIDGLNELPESRGISHDAAARARAHGEQVLASDRRRIVLRQTARAENMLRGVPGPPTAVLSDLEALLRSAC